MPTNSIGSTPQTVQPSKQRYRITRIVYPKTIRVDQGTEFASRDLDLWAYTKGITLDFSRSGKPTDNAFIEAFNGRFRQNA